MSLVVYSSLSKTTAPLKTLRDREVKIYTCGPTVYSYAHIGNFRAYLIWDMVVRTLKFLDYRVTHVMNITDVGHMTDDEVLASDLGEDKMEKAARRENKTVWDVARFYEEDFLTTLDNFHIHRAQHITRATEHIQEMITMIETLLAHKVAYQTTSGIYFDISSFPAYGNLSGNTLTQLQAHASGRVEEREEKRSPHDFVLWVLGKEQSMMWDSPWGRGYPGWHIECSAMARKYLGDQIDIHGGGVDNKFPHHECEIAQTECTTKKTPFAKVWMHTGMMTMEGEKMSKSKNNVYTPLDLQKKGYSLRVYRLLCYLSHYRSTMDFSWSTLDQAKSQVQSFDRFIERIEEVEGYEEDVVSREFSELLNETLFLLVEAMENDFNTPEFFAQYFEFMRKINVMLDAGTLSGAEADALLEFIETIDATMEVLLPWAEDEEDVPAYILELRDLRVSAKAEKDYQRADSLRKEIEEAGFILEDSKEGTKIRRK